MSMKYLMNVHTDSVASFISWKAEAAMRSWDFEEALRNGDLVEIIENENGEWKEVK